VYFVSDQTGVTVETLGHSLLEQFEGLEFETVTVPFVDSIDKAETLAARIDDEAVRSGLRPVVFASLVRDPIRAALRRCNGLVLDFFDAFLAPLESEFGRVSSHTFRREHGVFDSQGYNLRIEAINFALAADDGHAPQYYEQADIILLGVSRSGKTPTCLYLALQYGIFAANYPLTGDELETGRLPRSLEPYRRKLYGLKISPERLRQIRLERRSSGRYASIQQISFELRAADALFQRLGIRSIDTTHSSIEEIASKILSDTGLERRLRA
jgi:hypothetical protein